MREWTIAEFAARCGGRAYGFQDGATFQGFSLDSRNVDPGSLFLAISGSRADGHEFTQAALASGAMGCLVEREVSGPHIVVPDLVDALARFARGIRATFHGPVVGITGSAGKTTTKEFTAAALSPMGRVLKNPGNRNTEYTSPLVWADLMPEHAAAVIEMSMRGAGQIAHLASFVQPTIGVITNIGTAHVEMVGSRRGVFEAKAEMLQHLRKGATCVFWQEDEFLGELRAAVKGKCVTFGFDESADCRILGYRAISWDRSELRLQIDGSALASELPTIGRPQALNAAAAVLAASLAGVSPAEAAARLISAEMPPMRMEAHNVGQAVVLLDTYNANPSATVVALQTLAELPSQGRKIAVLGAMRELGEFTESGHRQVGRALLQSPVVKVVLFGDETKFIRDEAEQAGYPASQIVVAQSLSDVSECLQRLEPGDVVLIKGSRALELERALPSSEGES